MTQTFWHLTDHDRDNDNYDRSRDLLGRGLFVTEELAKAKAAELNEPDRLRYEHAQAIKLKDIEKRQKRWDTLKAVDLEEGPRPAFSKWDTAPWEPCTTRGYYDVCDVEVTE